MTYNGLHPVHSAGSHPHQIPGLLDEAVHRDVLLVQILQDRPPGTGQVVQIVPTTQAHVNNVGLGLTRSSLKLTFRVYNPSSLNLNHHLDSTILSVSSLNHHLDSIILAALTLNHHPCSLTFHRGCAELPNKTRVQQTTRSPLDQC